MTPTFLNAMLAALIALQALSGCSSPPQEATAIDLLIDGNGCPPASEICSATDSTIEVTQRPGAEAKIRRIDVQRLSVNLVIRDIQIESDSYGILVISSCKSCTVTLANITVTAKTDGIVIFADGPVVIRHVEVVTAGGGKIVENPHSPSRAGLPAFHGEGGGAGIQVLSRTAASVVDATVTAQTANAQAGIFLRVYNRTIETSFGPGNLPGPVDIQRARISGYAIGVYLEGDTMISSLAIDCADFGILISLMERGSFSDVDIHGCHRAGIFGSGHVWRLQRVKISNSTVALYSEGLDRLQMEEFQLTGGDTGLFDFGAGASFIGTMKDGFISGYRNQGAILDWLQFSISNVTVSGNGNGHGGSPANRNYPNGGLIFPLRVLALTGTNETYVRNVSVANSHFFGNNEWSVWAERGQTVLAQNNWWNTTSGPILRPEGAPRLQPGEAVSEGVVFAPWRTSP